jgi:predicted nucleotidyltransferase
MRATRSGESALLLLDVIDLLADQNIEYAVVGALAASIHGAVRASMDADVVLSVGVPQAEGIEQKLKIGGFQTELARGDFDDPIPALLKVIDQYGNRVDLLIGLKGLEPQAFSRVTTVAFQGSTVRFIGREDFIAMKVFAGGPMDLVDAARAVTAAGASLDLELVRRLAKRFGRDALESLERLLKG